MCLQLQLPHAKVTAQPVGTYWCCQVVSPFHCSHSNVHGMAHSVLWFIFFPKITLFDKYQAKLFNHSTAGLCWKRKVRPDLQVPYNCPVCFNTSYPKLQISLTAWRNLWLYSKLHFLSFLSVTFSILAHVHAHLGSIWLVLASDLDTLMYASSSQSHSTE